MPDPFSNLISAIEAPVSSFRHSIFSCTPLSDFSRQGMESALMRISSSFGVSLGRSFGSVVMACDPSVRRPADALELDEPRQIADVRTIGQPMHRPHLVHEHDRAERLVGRYLVAEDRLDLVLAAAERNDDIGMKVDGEIDGLPGIEVDLPDPHVLVLQRDALAAPAERVALFVGG